MIFCPTSTFTYNTLSKFIWYCNRLFKCRTFTCNGVFLYGDIGTSSTTESAVINFNPNSNVSQEIKHQLTGKRWHTWQWQQWVHWSTWELVSHRQVQLVTEEVSLRLRTNLGVALQKKYHVLALLTAALHQLYTLKDAWRSYTLTVILCRPHSTSADGLDATVDAGFGPLFEGLQSQVICSLTQECVCIILFPRSVFLFLSLLLREYGYIEYTLFIDFHIMSLKRVTCASV